MNNYVIYHLHTDLSNGTTTLDSVNKMGHYIKKAKELGMKAIAFSEHGSLFEWLHKKEACEKIEFTCGDCGEKYSKNKLSCDKCGCDNVMQTTSPLKYIHGAEFYVTKDISEKIRDNYHVGLYARNKDGFKEINRLSSKSFNREDGHFYHNPRITFEELINTSNNVIVTTACLGGILWSGDDDIKRDFIKFLSDNKERCFLEIQHHNVKDQIKYNTYLKNLSDEIGVRLIAGTDTHYLNKDYEIGRKILQYRKGIRFENEDGWDLSFKNYEELVDAYEKQGSLHKDVYTDAINNTNVFSDMIEEFSVDTSFKYPKLYENSEDVISEKISFGMKNRNILSKEYKDRVEYEMDVYRKQGATDFLLLEEDIKSSMRKEGRICGYSRGSVSGSVVAYALGITEVDSLKYNLYFERFMNSERVSLADVDTDWSPYDRDRVKEYIHVDMKSKFNGLYTSEIITFNTIALKGALKDVTGGLRELHQEGKLGSINFPESELLSLEEADEISKDIEDNEGEYRKKYPTTFKYIDMLKGVIVSLGSHPAGTIVSPIPLDDEVGTFSLSTNKYPVSQLNMKEVDSLNFVKLDILGLDNVGIINRACEFAGIDYLTPDNMDFEDDNVWDNMVKHPLGIFQFESPFAHSMLKTILSKEVIEKVKKQYNDISRIALMSMANGAIRPAGASYRDALSNGEFRDNGHKALNDMLGSTLSYLVFQEQLLLFLNKFCGYSLGEADIVRRGFAKKTGTEKFIPKIKEGFINTMRLEYGVDEQEAEKLIESFLVIIIDASDYLFSSNHSDPYSMIGFATAYLRTYYPLEFLTAVLEINETDLVKTSKAIEYMRGFTDIKVQPAKFRKSKGGYMPDKGSNIIYKGVGSIKNLNSQIGDFLYSLRDVECDSFIDLIEISQLNKTQIETLIKIDYFSEFGSSKKLLEIYNKYRDWATKKTAKKDNLPFEEFLIKMYSEKETDKQYSGVDYKSIIKIWAEDLPNEDFSITQKIAWQVEFLGSINIVDDSYDSKTVVVTALDSKYSPKATVYSIKKGTTGEVKFRKSQRYNERDLNYDSFDKKPFAVGDVLYCGKFKKEAVRKKVGDDWVDTGDFEHWCVQYEIIERA